MIKLSVQQIIDNDWLYSLIDFFDKQYDVFAAHYYRKNPYTNQPGFVFAADAKSSLIINALEDFLLLNDYVKGEVALGYLSFDLQELFFQNTSSAISCMKDDLAFWFIPQTICVLDIQGIHWIQGNYKHIKKLSYKGGLTSSLKMEMDKGTYIPKAKEVQKHIRRGDIYEMNLCQILPFEEAIDPLQTFMSLNQTTMAPHNGIFKNQSTYILCGSPELYLQKEGNHLVSEPIKGTRRRGKTEWEDRKLKASLEKDKKEINENIMIVDLVRNDLSQIAQRGSVKVSELCKVYSFPTVHQMISKVECTTDASLQEIIQATFPMGSMTGVPKQKMLEIAAKLEDYKRGIYSGSLLMIQPNGDFVANVIIRSIIYHAKQEKGYIGVGGAITHLSEPQNEYDECMLKLEAMSQSLVIKC